MWLRFRIRQARKRARIFSQYTSIEYYVYARVDGVRVGKFDRGREIKP